MTVTRLSDETGVPSAACEWFLDDRGQRHQYGLFALTSLIKIPQK